MGFTFFILLVPLKTESIQIKAPPFGKRQSLLKHHPELPPHPTPQMAVSRHLPCASGPNSSFWEVSQDPHCFDWQNVFLLERLIDEIGFCSRKISSWLEED